MKIYYFTTLLLSLSILFANCKNESTSKESNETLEEQNYISIVTEAMEFQMPDTIPSGWNTFKYENKSTQTHFFLIDNYPEGKTLEDMKNQVGPVFDSGMKLITEGKSNEGFAEFAKLPEWFSEVSFEGGSGLISPNTTGTTCLKMEPGYYIIECYVKMTTGVFHTSMGMTKEIIVSENDSGNQEPEADVEIQISSTEGIVVNDTIERGENTFSVFYKDQIVHENFVGHDISLAKIGSQANIDSLNHWMNWATPTGLREPAPKAVRFMGGVNDMPAGSKAYFTATLDPGDYVLISEVPDPRSKNMMKKFSVSD